MKSNIVMLLLLAGVVGFGTSNAFGQSDRPDEGRGGIAASRRSLMSSRMSGSQTTTAAQARKSAQRSSTAMLAAGVRHRVPQDFSTIQAAINASVDGDTVLVSEGTYLENIRYKGKTIVVGSLYLTDGDTLHIGKTIIDGSKPSNPDSGSVVYFMDGEDTTSVLCGCTIRGGTGTAVLTWGIWNRAGGGVYCESGGAKLVRNTIARNRVIGPAAYGGGVAFEGYGPSFPFVILEGNRISDNLVRCDSAAGWAFSGGADIWNTSARTVGNVFESDTVLSAGWGGDGGMYFFSDHETGPYPYGYIQGNIFRSNIVNGTLTWSGGGGLEVYYTGDVFILDNVFEGNSVSSLSGYANGGGVRIDDYYAAGYGRKTILRNRFLNNRVFSQGMWARGGGIELNGTLATIAYNELTGNNASSIAGCDAGGIHLDSCAFRLENNIFRRNWTPGSAGGLTVYQPPRQGTEQVVVNNTFFGNRASGSGGAMGISSSAKVVAFNNICWADTSGSEISVDGSSQARVQYCDVQGGYSGTGNINVDPRFAENAYRLSDSSYCIGRGTDSIQIAGVLYRSPGSDFFGSVRPNPAGSFPDMGACENHLALGPPPPKTDTLMGPRFRAFYDRIMNAGYRERNAIVDSFMTAHPLMPYVEADTVCHFIYRGAATSVCVPSPLNNWDVAQSPMFRLSITDLWFRAEVFPADTRLEYRFFVNDTGTIYDPHNPKVVGTPPYDHSELRMPAYVQPPELLYYPGIPHGTLKDTSFYSAILGNSRIVRVYTPPGYNPAAPDSFALVLFHDGLPYVDEGLANNALDYLIDSSWIKPCIGVFVNSVSRDPEYIGDQQDKYATFIATELMPYIDARYRTRRRPESRATIGISNGGNIALWLAHKYPSAFGNAASHSGSILGTTYSAFQTGPLLPLKLYVDAGTYDLPGYLNLAKDFTQLIQSQGYSHRYNQWHDCHGWMNWGAHLDNVLKFFFPGPLVGIEANHQNPASFALLQNYPNPFNPTTTIKFGLPTASHVNLTVYDILGREVTVLVKERRNAGVHAIRFDASNLASGVYIYRLQAGESVSTMKMLVLK